MGHESRLGGSPDDTLNEFFRIHDPFPRDSSTTGMSEEIRISQARTSLYLDYPLFGEIICRLNIFATNSLKLPSFGCNSRNLYFNPVYTLDKGKAELKGMIAHCAIHLILDHYHKLEDENLFIYKLATELSTLQILEEIREEISLVRGYFDYPLVWNSTEAEGVLKDLMHIDFRKTYNNIEYLLWREGETGETNAPDESNGLRDLTVAQMKRIQNKIGLKQMCQYWEVTELLQRTLKENSKLEDLRFREIIRSSLLKNRNGRIMPDTVEAIIQKEYKISTPWYVILERYLQENVALDWLWLPPNRRYVNDNLYFPSTRKKQFRVYVAIRCNDTINDNMTNELLTEIYNTVSAIYSFELRIIGFDNDGIEFDILLDDASYFHEISEVLMGSNNHSVFRSFYALFDYIAELPHDPDLLIIFTPSSSSSSSMNWHKIPKYKVLWITLVPAYHFFGDSIVFDNDTQLESWDHRNTVTTIDTKTRVSKNESNDGKKENSNLLTKLNTSEGGVQVGWVILIIIWLTIIWLI